MGYEIPEKLKKLQIYDPVTENFRVRLDANESFLNLPEEIREDVLCAVARIEFNRYPDPLATELCRKFGAFFQVKPELLTAGNGSDELISLIISSFLEPGQTVLTVMPDFYMYVFYAQSIGANVEILQKGEDLEISVEDVIGQARQTKAKLLIFSNPCNPTSLNLSREDILRIVENVDALVAVDEAYMDFSEGSVLDEIENYDNLIVLKTCSKAFGMAAIRLGFAASNPQITGILRTVKSPYNVNSMTQAVGCAVLEHQDYLRECIAKIRKSTEDLYREIQRLEKEKEEIQKVYPTCTNFIYLKTKRAQELFETLKTEGISIRYINGCLRIAAGSESENKELIQALERFLR